MSNDLIFDRDYLLDVTTENGAPRSLFIAKGAKIRSGVEEGFPDKGRSNHTIMVIDSGPADDKDTVERLMALGYREKQLKGMGYDVR